MASNPYVNKVVYGNTTLIDISGTTATASDVASGKIFYAADGTQTSGTATSGGGSAITVTDTTDAGGGTIRTIAAVDLSNDTVSASTLLSGYTAHDSTGNAVTGSISTKTDSDLTASGDTVTVPAGYYASQYTKSVSSGTATTPATTITATPSISVNSSTGVVTASVSASESVTPTVSAGYVSSGTAGTVTVSGSNTEQLPTQAAQTITPTTSNQTIPAGTYLTGAQTISGDANLVASNIVSGVSIFGITGTASSGGGASNVVSGTFKGTSSGALTIPLSYTGSGYPIACIIFPSAGVYTDSTYYDTIQRYAIGFYSMTKSDTATTPTYSSSGSADYGTTLVLYKSSTSNATSFSRTGSQTVNAYGSSAASASNSTCVRFRSATSLSVYIAASSYGFMSGVEYAYWVMYSS